MSASERPDRLAAEVAHVLFLDLVGFSRFSMEEQARLTRELRGVVRGTPEFVRAESRGDLIGIDTGDGMALVFFRDPLAPVQCATEIARTLKSHERLRLRMGVHSGPVSRVLDINGKENVTGSGINMAQRVMDCGDAGHVLVSSTSAEFIREFEAWASCLVDLGEVEVKHGARLRLFNLLIDGVGNPAVPSSVTPRTAPRVSGDGGKAQSESGKGQKVALLYRRRVPADERLLGLLKTELTARGFEVFIDQHLHIGVEWAAEIARQIRSADAVIPLLSSASIHSEMLEYEVQQAHEAAQTQEGKPRLLPVRVGYEGPLPDALEAVLGPLQYALWEGEADDSSVVQEIVSALAAPSQPAAAARLREPAGGAVPLGSRFYIVRPTDHLFADAIARQDSIVLVKGGRQMGKTSLLARGLQQARESGAKVVFTDFQALSASHLLSPDALYRALAEAIADQLDLDTLPDEVWNEKRGANVNLERYLRREVLGAFDGTLVWGMDEVDRLFTCPFGSEVFGLFRSWHNRRSLDPSGPWSRLTLAIAYATEAHLFITDLNQSPFNVGTRLALDDFSREQVAELNRRYEQPLRTPDEVGRFYDLLGGQPYLTRRGFDALADGGTSFAAFEIQAGQEDGPFGDHLRRILISLTQDNALTEAVRSLLKGGDASTTPESFYRLRGAGILAGDAASTARLRCRLYTDYLSRHLI